MQPMCMAREERAGFTTTNCFQLEEIPKNEFEREGTSKLEGFNPDSFVGKIL